MVTYDINYKNGNITSFKNAACFRDFNTIARIHPIHGPVATITYYPKGNSSLTVADKLSYYNYLINGFPWGIYINPKAAHNVDKEGVTLPLTLPSEFIIGYFACFRYADERPSMVRTILGLVLAGLSPTAALFLSHEWRLSLTGKYVAANHQHGHSVLDAGGLTPAQYKEFIAPLSTKRDKRNANSLAYSNVNEYFLGTVDNAPGVSARAKDKLLSGEKDPIWPSDIKHHHAADKKVLLNIYNKYLKQHEA